MDVTNFLQPELVEVNRLPARQPFKSYPNVEQARLSTSRFRRSLDGTWRFKLIDSPSSAPRRWQRVESAELVVGVPRGAALERGEEQAEQEFSEEEPAEVEAGSETEFEAEAETRDAAVDADADPDQEQVR